MSIETQHVGATAPIGGRLDVRWRYYSGYYDGPLSGLVTLPDGTEAWAECIETCECPRYDDDADLTDDEADAVDHGPPVHGFYRRYQLYRLAAEQAAIQAERHEDFRRWVGTHTDLGENGTRAIGAVRPIADHHHFYDKWKPGAYRSTIEGATPIGWFET